MSIDYATQVEQAADAADPWLIGLIRLDTVRPERVRWLWPGRIPLGKLTVLDGDPGLGKSTLALDLAARVSTGAAMPDSTRSDLGGPAGVVILSAEDGLADTILPRSMAAGADVARVVALQTVTDAAGEEQQPTLPDDLDALRYAIDSAGARLVIVDPLMAYLGGRTDSHRDQDIRRALAPLARLAEDTGAAVLVIRHLSKAAGADPLYRGGGSIGIIGAARSGLLVAPDPDDPDRRILAPLKNNLARPAPALVWRLVSDPASLAAGIDVARIEWLGETTHTAAQLLAVPAGGEDRGAAAEAAEFLRDALADGSRPASDVQREARAAGISKRTLDRTKAAVGVRSVRSNGAWQWTLPPKDAKIAKVANPQDLAILAILDEFGNLGNGAAQHAAAAPRYIPWQPSGDEWEVVPADSTDTIYACPPGLEYRLDANAGTRVARWPPGAVPADAEVF